MSPVNLLIYSFLLQNPGIRPPSKARESCDLAHNQGYGNPRHWHSQWFSRNLVVALTSLSILPVMMNWTFGPWNVAHVHDCSLFCT